MFLFVSVCHVGAHPGKHQHGVSIQISISLGKTFLRISCIRKIPLTWILMRVFVYVPPFISQILDFIYWTVLVFILIYFEWRDTSNNSKHIIENVTVKTTFAGTDQTTWNRVKLRYFDWPIPVFIRFFEIVIEISRIYRNIYEVK